MKRRALELRTTRLQCICLRHRHQVRRGAARRGADLSVSRLAEPGKGSGPRRCALLVRDSMPSTLSSRLHLSDPTPERKRREIRHETTSARLFFRFLDCCCELYSYCTCTERSARTERGRARTSRALLLLLLLPIMTVLLGSRADRRSASHRAFARLSSHFSLCSTRSILVQYIHHLSMRVHRIRKSRRTWAKNYSSAVVVRAGPSEPEPTTRAQSRERLDTTREDFCIIL